MDERFARKYRDPRWQRRRLEVLEAADFACEHCGATDQELHVHHTFYRKDADPWDYEDGLSALCVSCHKEMDAARRALAEVLSRCTASSLRQIMAYAEQVGDVNYPMFPVRAPEDALELAGIADAFRCDERDVVRAFQVRRMPTEQWADLWDAIWRASLDCQRDSRARHRELVAHYFDESRARFKAYMEAKDGQRVRD